jgi:protein involved in polysaccharide export with SLBB domain
MKTRHFVFAVVLFCGFSQLNTSVAQDIKNLDINSLNSSQLNQAKQALQNSGLSREQAIAEARKRGASDAQVQQMIKRMEGTNAKQEKDTIFRGDDFEAYLIQDSLDRANQYKLLRDSLRKINVYADSIIFGSLLFKNKYLTFEPSLNIQTPKKYEITIGDEVIINIWGNSVQDYQLNVDKNGQIQIPQIGPVYIAGKTFDEATRIIKQRLIAIYSGMAGSQPNTFAQVNMGRLRSIRVNLVGEVQIPGTFTLPATATVFNALYLSGGPNLIGSFRNVQIYRENELIKSLDIYDFLLKGDQKDNIVLKNDDVIFVPVIGKTVRMSGEFKRQATYELKDEETLKDLVSYAGGLSDKAYMTNLKIYRKTQVGMKIFDIPMNQWDMTSVNNGDQLVAQKIRTEVKNRVTIAGSVFRPGEYEWKENMLLSDLILIADSIVPNAMVEMGQMTRVNPDSTLSLISFNVRDIMSGKNDISLKPKDSVMIKSHFELKDKPTITVDGRVRKGGSFDYMENMSPLDAIYLAGGFSEDADSTFVQISRRLTYQEAASLTDKLVDVFNIPLPRQLNANDQTNSFKLQPYDHIYIRKAPGYVDQGRVFIGGEVVYAGYYAIQNKKNRISDMMSWAGGMTPEAYIEGTTFSKIDAGKVGLDLKKVLDNPGSINDLLLNPGDSLYIPKRPETVNVLGQVQNPFAKVYIPGKTVKYYIKNSGGWGDSPDKRRVYITYPDGSSDMTKNFIFIKYPRVKPGSQIIVPKKPEHVARPELAQVWLGIGSTAATLAVTVISIVSMLK